MQKILPPLDDAGDPRRLKLIAELEGGALLHDLAAKKHREAADMLRGLPGLHPPANDDGEHA